MHSLLLQMVVIEWYFPHVICNKFKPPLAMCCRFPVFFFKLDVSVTHLEHAKNAWVDGKCLQSEALQILLYVLATSTLSPLSCLWRIQQRWTFRFVRHLLNYSVSSRETRLVEWLYIKGGINRVSYNNNW